MTSTIFDSLDTTAQNYVHGKYTPEVRTLSGTDSVALPFTPNKSLATGPHYGKSYFSFGTSQILPGDGTDSHSINASINRNAQSGYVVSDGPDAVKIIVSETVNLSNGDIEIKNGESLDLEGYNVNTIGVRCDSGTGSYRILAK